ncbi:MAG: glycerol-3-phosphate acyltransferase [Syntrophomonadaceae bacterium]|nr:glycerol-3-phosphate acyltransferase [Syntrophomonadaceae bacterium]
MLLKLIIVSYLIGSIPFAFFLAWIWRKVDIRVIGSENVGTTNVFKEIGVLPGMLTGILDGLKGLVAALIGMGIMTNGEFFALIAAMTGHIWPAWLKFHGGGGLATFIGGMLIIYDWWVILMILGIWGAAYSITKKHDLSALIACYVCPFILGIIHSSWNHFIFGIGAAFVVGLKRLQSIRKNSREEMMPRSA